MPTSAFESGIIAVKTSDACECQHTPHTHFQQQSLRHDVHHDGIVHTSLLCTMLTFRYYQSQTSAGHCSPLPFVQYGHRWNQNIQSTAPKLFLFGPTLKLRQHPTLFSPDKPGASAIRISCLDCHSQSVGEGNRAALVFISTPYLQQPLQVMQCAAYATMVIANVQLGPAMKSWLAGWLV